MVFSSITFLFVFLPIFLAVYYFLPERHRNLWLFFGSLAFYAYGAIAQPLYLVLIVASVAVNYLLGRLIGSGRHRRAWLVTGLVYNFGWLFLFKYADFLMGSLQSLLYSLWPHTAVTIPYLGWILPIGISFYTFQIASYLVDVYRGTVPAESSFLRLGTYLCMFPQLIAGPIVTYSSVSMAIKHRHVTLVRADEGLKDFIAGLGLKVLLANQIGNLWTDISTIGYDSISTPLAWMGIVAFSLQLYFDFYGYSLMAVGLGEMLGFELPDNFRHPYMAVSMTDFWRRWHITLGSWFREYVYIPLGGNRKGKGRTVLNLLIVWLLTGLWHGASWNFALWGLVLFFVLVIEKFAIGQFLNRHRTVGHLYMILLIPLTWLIFAVTDFGQLGVYFSRLLPFLPGPEGNIYSGDWLLKADNYGVLLAMGILFCTEWPARLYHRFRDSTIGTLLLLCIFWLSAYCLYIGLNDPFLYFRF